jgi:hypothetical protein
VSVIVNAINSTLGTSGWVAVPDDVTTHRFASLANNLGGYPP